MSRKPASIFLPSDNLKQLAHQVQDHLHRLYLEAADYRELCFHLGSLSDGQVVNIRRVAPLRDRRFLRLEVMYNVLLANVGNSLNVKLYSGGVTATDVIFDLTVAAGATNGDKSGTATTVVNAGKEVLDLTTGWTIIATQTGGGGNAIEDVTIGVVYEDYTPYYDRVSS